jgi:glycosyltransferase involved in cell wall biosynthesis
MSKTPLISIITVCFNSAKTIRQTIESVLNQTYTHIEYILVDGKSTDNTLAIIEEYAPQFAAKGIVYRWISEPDNGIYDAMNKGIKLATGEWVNIQGSDDWLELDACYLISQSISNNQECNIIYGISNYFCDGKLISVGQNMHTNLLNAAMNHQSIFMKKKLIENLGYFDQSFSIAADYDLLCNAFTSGANFHYLSNIIANYNIGGISFSSAKLGFENVKIRYKYKQITQTQKLILNTKYYIKYLFSCFDNIR